MFTHVHCARPFFGSTPNTLIYHCTGRQIDSICSSTFNLFVSSSSLGVFYRWSHSSHIQCSTCNAMQWLRLHSGTLDLNNDKITCRLSRLRRRYLFSPTLGSAGPSSGVSLSSWLRFRNVVIASQHFHGMSTTCSHGECDIGFNTVIIERNTPKMNSLIRCVRFY